MHATSTCVHHRNYGSDLPVFDIPYVNIPTAKIDTKADYLYPHECKRWGHHVRCYSGIGDLPFCGNKALNDDLFVSRSHKHYGNGLFVGGTNIEPYQVTSLKLHDCRCSDQVAPDIGKTDFSDREKFPIHANYKVSPYFTHKEIHQDFPTIDIDRVDSYGNPSLSENTRKALHDLRNRVYCTTSSMHHDPMHDDCMKLNKHPGNADLFKSTSGCPVRCRVPFLQQSFSVLYDYVQNKDLTSILNLLLQLKNHHTCNHTNLLCTTNDSAYAQPYCLLWEMINTAQNPTMDVDTKMYFIRQYAEWARANGHVQGHEDGFKKLAPYPPESQYSYDTDKSRLQGCHGKPEKCTNYATRLQTLELKLNRSFLKDLQDDPPEPPPPFPKSAPSQIEWARRRCAVKDYTPQMDPSQPPTLQSLLYPTGNRIQDRLGLRFRTPAYQRFHSLYTDSIPNPINVSKMFNLPTYTPKRHSFWGYNGAVFRGNG